MKMDDRDDLDPRRSMQQQGHAGGASQTSSMPLPERTFGIMDSTSNRETPNPSTTCLPRSQRIESSSSHGYPIPPLELEDSDSLPHQADAVEEEPPRFSLYRTLLLCLLLTTTLAVGSAFDAKIQCLSHEMYYLLDLVDDDTVDVSEIVIMQEQIECVEMFSKVIKPVGAITLACGIAAVIFIHRHLRYTNSLEEHIKPPHFAGLVKLLLIFMPVLIIWTYGIFSIMLRPKKRTEGNGRNPYNSLAAVDQKGHIGDNANLFYLSWISEGIVVSMFYQMIVDCLRWSKFGLVKPLQQEVLISPTTSNRLDEITPVYIQIQNIIKSYARANRLSAVYKQRRKTLYQVMVKLRQRSGFWAATVCFCAVILASSGILYLEVLYPIANAQIYVKPSQFREVCAIVKYTSNNFPDEYCTRTSFTVLSGIISCALSLVALLLHWIVRRRTEIDASSKVCGTLPAETHHYALWSELITSFLLSVLLGVNAVFATGVQGPAVNVGNMYYASWISFLLCLRICLGCLEEVYRAEINSDDEEEKSDTAIVPEREKDIATISKSLSSTSLRSSVKDEVATPQYRLERTSRLRLYLCLSVFSTVCSASAWDSAFNQESSLSKNQLYVMIAPALVALVSGVMFLLCLRPRGYSAVANLWIGGIISLICFAAWFADLIITMHSQDSWAVNSIGEIRMANLYYFSWASISKYSCIAYIFDHSSTHVHLLSPLRFASDIMLNPCSSHGGPTTVFVHESIPRREIKRYHALCVVSDC